MSVFVGLQGPHHDGSLMHVSTLSPQLGDVVTLRLRIPLDDQVESVALRWVEDGEPRFVDARRDGGTAGEQWWAADLVVHNPMVRYRFLLRGGAAPYRWVNAWGCVHHDVTDLHDFCVVAGSPLPSWLADAVGYQIFPDRFCRMGDQTSLPSWAVGAQWDAPVSDDWRISTKEIYGGNLAGIESQLDHIVALGANLLYLTPVFPSHSSHRYDATTFDHIDPLLGGDAAYASLIDAVHRRGMHIIGDLTTNHSGDGHEWFQRAVSDATSDEASYYLFENYPDEHIGWCDVPTLPKFDHRSPLLRQRLIDGDDSVVKHWMRAGLDGWRVDVANMTPEPCGPP
jgi:alpha-glucosidase